MDKIISFKCFFILCICCFLLFCSPISVNAEFSYSDSSNLSSIRTDVSTIRTTLSSQGIQLSQIVTQTTASNTKLTSIDSELTLCYNKLTSLLTELENVHDDTTELRSEILSLITVCTNLQNRVDDIYTAITQSSQQTQNVISNTSAATQNTIIETSQQTQNVITNSIVSNDSMVVSTDSYEVQDEQVVDNFFTNFLQNMKDTFSGVDTSVSVIQIPFPFVEGTIELRSDVISSVLSGTYLATLVELFWYFVFGTYYIIFVKGMLDWLSTGEVAKSGVTGFIKHLDNQNQIIKTYMM